MRVTKSASVLLGALLLAVLFGPACTRPIGSWFPGEAPGLCDEPAGFDCTRREDGPCSRFITVAAECSEPEGWRCPAGTSELDVVVEGLPTCLPLFGETSPFTWLGSMGTPVERTDGRCMWIMADGVVGAGEHLSHPALLLPETPVGGNCVAADGVLGGSEPYSVADETALGVEVIASMGDGFLHGGRSWIFYRHWVWDATQPFGVRLIGTRLANYDAPSESVHFLPGFLWQADVAFGDAAVVADGVPYVYGCHGPPVFLSHECYLARLAGGDLNSLASYEYYAGNGQWTADIAQEAVIFESGPHRTGVRFHPGWGSYVMLYIHGFGTQVELRTADAPEGPWTEQGVLVDCELPADDLDAFCATAALHLELMSDWRPDELVLTYEVGSLAPDAEARRQAAPGDYWPRLARVSW